MLQSADIAAKLLSGNTLTSRKVHLVGAAGHDAPSILWPNPQNQIKQPLNFEPRQSARDRDGRHPTRKPSPLPLGMS
jgi:hypothetical protein